MSEDKRKNYQVYRDARRIELQEICFEKEQADSPCLKVSVSIDGCTIENVTFKRDIASRAYAAPPSATCHKSPEVTVLFGGEVQEILDRFADYILPPMKPLGLNPLTGEKILDGRERTNAREIAETSELISTNTYIWQKETVSIST